MAEPPKVECPFCYSEIEIGDNYAECPSHHIECEECARRQTPDEIGKLESKLEADVNRLDMVEQVADAGAHGEGVLHDDPVPLRRTIAETQRLLENVRIRRGLICSYCLGGMDVKTMDAENLQRLKRIAVENARQDLRSRNADRGNPLNDAQLEEEFIRRGLNLPNEELQPQEAVRLDIAEEQVQAPRGAAAAVAVPLQPQHPEGHDDVEAAVIAASMRTAREDERRRIAQEEAELQEALRLFARQEEDPFFSEQAEGLRGLIDDYTRETRTELTGNLDELVTTLTRFIVTMSRMRGEPRVVSQELQIKLRNELQAYYIPHRARQQQRQPPQLAIFDMGFDPHIVARALDTTRGNEEAAIQLLLDQQPFAHADPRGNAGAAAPGADDDDAELLRQSIILSMQREQPPLAAAVVAEQPPPPAAVVQPRSLIDMVNQRQQEAAARAQQSTNQPPAKNPTRRRGGYKMSRKSKRSKKSRKLKLSKKSRKSKMSRKK
jgi:hypothetical protein